MSSQETQITTDLILRSRIIGVPITFRGTLEDGTLVGISGNITIKKTLAEVLGELLGALGFDSRNTEDPAKILNDLTGELMSKIALDSLAIGYRGTDTKFTQIAVTMSAASRPRSTRYPDVAHPVAQTPSQRRNTTWAILFILISLQRFGFVRITGCQPALPVVHSTKCISS